MENFEILVKNYGINPKGKSAPMAASKKSQKTQKKTDFIPQDPNFFTPKFAKSNSGNGSLLDDQNDDFYRFDLGRKHSIGKDLDEFDIESVLKGGNKSNDVGFDVKNGDDIWGFSEKSSTNVEVKSSNNIEGDLLSSDVVDEFWGKIGAINLGQKGVKKLDDDDYINKGNNYGGDDDLISGFDKSFSVNHRGQASAKETTSSVSLSSLDELEDFVTGKISKVANGHGGSSIHKSQPRKTVEQKPLETNFFDFDQSSDGGSVHKGKTEQVDLLFQDDPSDLDSFFKPQIKKSTSASASMTMPKTYKEPNLFSESGFGMDKKVPSRDSPDDFSFMFEGVSASAGFQEIEGESKERRDLRYASYLRCKARMEDAVAEMNQREFKAQQEQEERHRIADAMEMEMKRWAAGKEGNLRALLSSLQQVLGPDFGWRPVSLTDLITSAQVKLAYKKAALCVHPDKVQQRGADLPQKYVAEKTFDLLKEAWNKFSTEELR